MTEVEQRRSRTWATVVIETCFVPILRDQFGRHCDLEADLDDGRSRVRLAAPTPLDIARNLAGWGALVEVLDPPSVQVELARIGAELADRYAGGSQPVRHEHVDVPIAGFHAARGPGHTGPVTTGPLMTGVGDTGHGSVRRRRVDPERRVQLLKDLEELVLAEGFMALSMDDLAHRLRCSKATLYSVAGNKEQLVVALTKGFFRQATAQIEQAVAEVADPRLRVPAYLSGVGRAMSRCSTQFYADMIGLRSTASVYRTNSAAAARRVQELIAEGVKEGALRSIDGNFAGQLVALAIEGVQSGVLLRSSGLSAGEAYTEMADLLLHGLSAPPA